MVQSLAFTCPLSRKALSKSSFFSGTETSYPASFISESKFIRLPKPSIKPPPPRLLSSMPYITMATFLSLFSFLRSLIHLKARRQDLRHLSGRGSTFIHLISSSESIWSTIVQAGKGSMAPSNSGAATAHNSSRGAITFDFFQKSSGVIAILKGAITGTFNF